MSALLLLQLPLLQPPAAEQQPAGPDPCCLHAAHGLRLLLLLLCQPAAAAQTWVQAQYAGGQLGVLQLVPLLLPLLLLLRGPQVLLQRCSA
jgi:hypothetical protein